MKQTIITTEQEAALQKVGWVEEECISELSFGKPYKDRNGTTWNAGITYDWREERWDVRGPMSAILEVAVILGIAPVEQRKAEAYGELRDRLLDAAGDLDAAFVLLENCNPADAKRHLIAAIGRLMLGGKREHVSVPMDLARRYREVWYNPQQKRVRDEREEIERALAIAFRDALVVSEQTTPRPRPSEDSGPSPSSLHPDGQVLLNMVQTGLDSYDTPRITAELKTFFADEDEAAEPGEEETRER